MTIMARSKIRKPRKSLTNNNIEDLKKTLENGLYTHSSPPKLVRGAGGNKVRELIRAHDIVGLEEILLSGNGQSLINQPSTDKKVRNFLKTVPSYMVKIELVHDATERGNLRDLKALLDRRKLAKSKDSKGVGLLHKAVLHGHKDIVDYLIQQYPESVEVRDNDGRTPLHYSAASKSPEEMYNFISDQLMDNQFRDDKGKTAAYYMQRPSELSFSRNDLIRVGLSPTRKKRSPLSKKNSPIRKMISPPKREGMNITGANIRIWIHDQDLPKLEQIVWDGQGHRLLNETTNQTKVKQFLQLVPRLMTKIKEVHQASISGDLDTISAKADQPEILLAKDHNGLNPLHRAAALGHMDVCEWIVQKNQNSLFGTDKKGRTPLFFATNPTDGGEIFNYFVRSGADIRHEDQFNKTAEYYRGRPGDIDISIVYDAPSAPRMGGSIVEFPSSRYPSRNNSGGRSRPKGDWVTSPGGSERSLASDFKNDTQPLPPRKKTKMKQKGKNDFFNNLYNRGRKDLVGKYKYVDMSRATEREIEKMLQDGDVTGLEYVVLSGRGNDILGKSSWNDKSRKFIKELPRKISNIRRMKNAAGDGDAEEVRRLLRLNPKHSMGRDDIGAVPLHYGARSGNVEVVKLLVDCYPEAMYVEEQDRRVPVHYAAMSREAGAYQAYDLLDKKGSYVHACDIHGKSANDYFNETATGLHPDDESRSLSRNSEYGGLRPESISPARSPAKGRKSRNRSKSKSPARRNLSVSPARNKSKPSSRNNSKSPSRNKSKSPARNKNPKEEIKPKAKTKSILQKDGSKRKRKKKLNEIQQAILDAENEDYKGISQIILRGDGNRLVGKKSSNEEVQRFLEDLPESLESINEIQRSVENGDMRKAVNLIDRKEKAYVRDANGSNLLHIAAINGHTDITRYLVQNFPDLLHQKDKAGRTPMHYAAVVRDGGHLTKILKMSNGDPYVEDDAGHTPEEYESGFLTQKKLIEELELGREAKEKEDALLAQEMEVLTDEETNQEPNEKEEAQQPEEQEEVQPTEESEETQEEEEVTEEQKEEEETKEEETKEEEEEADKEEEGETKEEEMKEEEVQEEETKEEEEEETKEEEPKENPNEQDENPDMSEEIKDAIIRAESDDYEGLAEIIRRGEGHILLNKSSKDESVDGYLKKIPEILASIDKAYLTVENGDTKKVAELIDRKEKALVRTTNQASFLHIAVINGHSDTVRYLTKTYPSLLQTEDIHGRTPLHYAAVVRDGGHIYKVLLRSEANPRLKDKAGYTPQNYLHDPQLLTQWDILQELKPEAPKDDRPITEDSVASYYGSEEEGMEKADDMTLQDLEEAFRTLKGSDSHSLLKKHLSDEVFEKIKHRKTELGSTLLDAIQSGVKNLDSSIGIYAPDSESYVMFKELFDPIIAEYHGINEEDNHPKTDFGDINLFGDLNELGDYVVSTRIRCARSIEGYPFNPKMTVENYTELEQDAEGALDLLDGDLAGYYTSLGNIPEEEAQRLTNEHLMFKQGDRFLEDAGACRFWPQGRGIFLNSDDTLVVWVNEEDHLRIISMQKGGDVREVYDRFIRALNILEDRLPFSQSKKLGYHTFCPTNLGTAIRASVHIRLPNLGKDIEKLNAIAEQFYLQVRGTRGEHSEAEESVYDISNKRRLGLTEVETIQDMYEGIEEIIRVEVEMSLGEGN